MEAVDSLFASLSTRSGILRAICFTDVLKG